MKRDGFIFYESFRDATKELPDEVRLAVYDAIMDYALYGITPGGENNTVSAFFKLMRPQIDANISRRENGKKGGRPSQASSLETESEPSETESQPVDNQTETKQEPTCNLNGKAKAKAKDKAKDIPPTSPIGGKRERKAMSPEMEQAFESFWESYPRKVNKKGAKISFAKAPVDEYPSMMRALARDKVSDQWRRDGGQYVPMPTTWLNQERWRDRTDDERMASRSYWRALT